MLNMHYQTFIYPNLEYMNATDLTVHDIKAYTIRHS